MLYLNANIEPRSGSCRSGGSSPSQEFEDEILILRSN